MRRILFYFLLTISTTLWYGCNKGAEQRAEQDQQVRAEDRTAAGLGRLVEQELADQHDYQCGHDAC